MAIDPSKSVPDDAASVSSLQSMTEESAKAAMRAPVDQAWGNARGSLVGNIIGGLASSLMGIRQGGLFSHWDAAVDDFRSGQHDIEDRVDVIEGTQGFVHAYMSRNINAEWGIGNNWRDLPFDAQHGPALGASVSPNGEIVLGSQGLWQISAKAHAGSSGYGGSPNLVLEVDVLRPNGALYERKRVETHSHYTSNITGTLINTWETTIETNFPVVTNFAGARIKVRGYVGQWRWWKGGTRYTHLSATKQSGDPIYLGRETVPDETR